MRQSFPHVAALLLIGMLCPAAKSQPAENAPPPTRIAAVDLTRVFSQSTRRQAMEEALRERQT